MAVDKLSPNDLRAQSVTATVRGKTYHYLHATPPGPPRGTVVLVHGWPDLAFGWRYQVPYLLALGLEVLAPDMLGYGGTDAPQDLALYSLRSASDDLAALVRQRLGPRARVILGGHDWGGMLAWRVALWHPALLRGVFSVCTPYAPVAPPAGSAAAAALPALLARRPHLAYQAQLAGPTVERAVGRAPAALRALLAAAYGATGAGRAPAFTVAYGVHLETLATVGKPPLLSDAEMDFYVEQYARNGIRGPLNWYRTRRINFEEELALLKDGRQPKVQPPALMITASRDQALPPQMAKGMEVFFEDLTIQEVDGTHWALWEPVAAETNAHIGRFVEKLLGSPIKASL